MKTEKRSNDSRRKAGVARSGRTGQPSMPKAGIAAPPLGGREA